MRSRTAALIGVLGLMAGGTRAQALLDDLEAGNSINDFGGQWSFSGDFWDKGNSKILSAVDTSNAVPYFKGAYGGGYPDGSGNAAELHFRFGTIRPGTPPNTYDNNVSMSCPLGPDQALLDLTGAQAVSFYARSDKPMQVEMTLQTANITDYAYYGAFISVTPAWTKYTIKLSVGAGGLTRRPFGTEKPLDLTQSQAFAWEVNKGKNASLTEATLWVDNIVIEGYIFKTPEPRGSCLPDGCIGAPGNPPKPSALVSDFDQGTPGLNTLGLPWGFAAAMPMTPDAKPSQFIAGIDSSAYALDVTGQGYANSNGAMIGFALGDVWFTPEGYIQFPAVSLTNSLSLDGYLDATGSTGLYFDYKTTGDVDYVDLKAHTDQVYANDVYAVAYSKIKGTGGQWKGAYVKWNDFILPDWGPDFLAAEKTMTFNALASLEWSVTSAKKNVQGTLALDNVYLVGVNSVAAAVAPSGKAMRTAGPAHAPRARLAAGFLEVPFQAPPGMHRGNVQVTDASGRAVADFRFAAAGGPALVLRFPMADPGPRGMRLVRVSTRYPGGTYSARYRTVTLE